VELWGGGGPMNDDFIYESLWQAYQKEKQSNELQLLPKTFYEDIIEYIGKIPKNGSEEEKSLETNILNMLNNLFERRKQKLVIYAAYNKQIPTSIAQKEIEFYEKIKKAISSNTLEYTKSQDEKIVVLRSVQKIPEIILPSGRKVGPLENEQILEVKDKDDVKFLINNGICKHI
jgi:DNA replication initiation complex subunit (GINS family)